MRINGTNITFGNGNSVSVSGTNISAGRNVNINGVNINQRNGRTYVNGVDITDMATEEAANGIFKIVVESGTVLSIESDVEVEAQDVSGNVHAGNSVRCGNVGGNVNAGNSVHCGDVRGSATAGNSVYRK